MVKLQYNEEYISIVEYPEAEIKIMQLSDQYAGDVTAVARGGNGHRDYYHQARRA